jgi:thiamine biosynthesis lipoprotein
VKKVQRFFNIFERNCISDGKRIPALAIALILAACSRQPAYRERVFAGETQGTTYTIRVVRTDFPEIEAEAIRIGIAERLARIDSLMSTYRPDSEISRFNQRAETSPFTVSPEMIEVFDAARSVSETSGGAFDVTVAPLVRAWGFGPDGAPQPPPTDEIERLRQRVGYRAIEIDPAANTLRKTRPDVTADLNGIAQGYTVDKIAADFDSLGEENYMIEIGGEVNARGHNARGIPWQIGIERPVVNVREIGLVLPISNTAVSTSGDYRKYREIGGVRISHTIDPRSGKPIQHKLASVTIVHPSCALADAYCTAIMVLGPEEGYRLAVKEDLAALIIVHDERETFTERQTPQFEALASRPR